MDPEMSVTNSRINGQVGGDYRITTECIGQRGGICTGCGSSGTIGQHIAAPEQTAASIVEAVAEYATRVTVITLSHPEAAVRLTQRSLLLLWTCHQEGYRYRLHKIIIKQNGCIFPITISNVAEVGGQEPHCTNRIGDGIGAGYGHRRSTAR